MYTKQEYFSKPTHPRFRHTHKITNNHHLLLPLHSGSRNFFEMRGGEVNVKGLNRGGEGYFIGLSVAFPLKRFRLPIPDFWRSQHYRKLSWFYLHARPKADYRWKCFFVPAASTAANKTCNHRQASATERATTREKGMGEGRGVELKRHGWRVQERRPRWWNDLWNIATSKVAQGIHVYACFHNFRNFLWGEEEDFLRNVKVLYTHKQRIGKFEIAGRAIEDNSTIRYFINQIFGIGNSYES